MLRLLRLMLVVATRSFRPRRDLLLENIALRQQLAMFKGRGPRARLTVTDKWFWVTLRRLWPGWRQALMLVQPETVVRWHRAGFKLYWQWLSRPRNAAGRKCVSKELRLFFGLLAENPTWGTPRIHGELKMLGSDISERTVQRWMWKAPRNSEPAKRWTAFLNNHREVIAAMNYVGWRDHHHVGLKVSVANSRVASTEDSRLLFFWVLLPDSREVRRAAESLVKAGYPPLPDGDGLHFSDP